MILIDKAKFLMRSIGNVHLIEILKQSTLCTEPKYYRYRYLKTDFSLCFNLVMGCEKLILPLYVFH